MYKYFISFLLLFSCLITLGQEQPKDSLFVANDSVVYKSAYGFRLGVDISKPIKAAIDKHYNTGFEIVGDYRISKRFYIAAELGYEDENSIESFTNSTAKGSYIRLGANYNAYENWLDMNNEIFVGLRYGFSLFEQTLNSYTPNVVSGEIGVPPYFSANPITTPVTESGLNAHWTELMVGFKVETFKNLFLGASFSYKILISVTDPDNFKALYSPGFNRIFESGTGFGFNYTISYLIPFKKK